MKKGKLYAVYLAGGLGSSKQSFIKPLEDMGDTFCDVVFMPQKKRVRQFNTTNIVTWHEIYKQGDLF